MKISYCPVVQYLFVFDATSIGIAYKEGKGQRSRAGQRVGGGSSFRALLDALKETVPGSQSSRLVNISQSRQTLNLLLLVASWVQSQRVPQRNQQRCPDWNS